MQTAELYDLLAAVVNYPGEDYARRVARCVEALAGLHPQSAVALGRFRDHIAPLSVEELQERYTRTFDMDPNCALDIGWHLFGENYDRGTFLVRMRQELRRHALAETQELPDHLTHVLAVLGRMAPDKADEFAAACVLPALEKIRAGLAGKDNPYKDVLDALAGLLGSRHNCLPEETLAATGVLPVLNGRELL